MTLGSQELPSPTRTAHGRAASLMVVTCALCVSVRNNHLF